MTPRDPDFEARRALARHRAIATGLLVLMAALTFASYALPQGVWTDLLQSAAKAGFVGGIADWFAIVALFRHPLGLPIPHTAILPRQKERLGRALGRFVANRVFTRAEVARTLGHIDLGGILGRYLSDPAHARPAAETLAAMLPRLLASVEDGQARRVMGRLLPRLLGGAETGRVMARALRGLVEGGRHHEMLEFILVEVREMLAARDAQIRAGIEDRVREQGGRLIGWALGATIADRILTTLRHELDRIGPDSGLREAFDEWVRREIARMEDDPERAAEIGRALRRVATHGTVQAWLREVWSRLRTTVTEDAVRPNGRSVVLLQHAIGNIGTVLATDPAARAKLQQALETLIGGIIPAAQGHLEGFIARVVAGWDAETVSRNLELRVGKDLQFVRINGTIVGFLVGGAAYAVLRAAFGHVVP